MDTTSMLPLIKSIPLFTELTQEQHQTLINGIILNYYPKDHVFFKEGDQTSDESCMYIVKSGLVDISRKDTFDHAKQIKVLQPNDFFGEMAFVLNEPRNATATAVEDCEVFELKKAVFTSMMESTPGAAKTISEEFLKRLKENK